MRPMWRRRWRRFLRKRDFVRCVMVIRNEGAGWRERCLALMFLIFSLDNFGILAYYKYEIINFKNSDKNLLSQKTKELEPLDNLIEELHLEISSFEQEKENHYKDVAEKLAYLNSLGSSKEKSIEDTVNTDKFKINLNNEVKEMIENEFMSLKTTFIKNLDQIKNGFNLIKSSYTNSDNEIDNPS